MSNLDPYSFFFETPLYTKIHITDENQSMFADLFSFNGSINAYSPSLKENTTYVCIQNPKAQYFTGVDTPTRRGSYVLECKRTNETMVIYVSWNQEKKIFQKSGQFPSIADLHISQIKKYDKVLSKEKIREFTRAIGLAANGVGIGSFVYLRRIFEGLIIEAYKTAKDEIGLVDTDFNAKKIADKIECLKDYLPEFLFKNKGLYSILSKGIHELDENECLEYFNVVKIGIEMILDEKVEQYQKKIRIEEAERNIQQIYAKVSKK